MHTTWRRRRLLALTTTAALAVSLTRVWGHRGTHAVRSLVLPGAGLYDHRHLALGIALTAAAVLATSAWLQWGADWLLAVVITASAALSGAVASGHPEAARVGARAPLHAAHEFPLVVIALGALAWVRSAWRGTRLGAWAVARRRTAGRAPRVSVVDRCRAATVTALTHRLDAPVHTAAADTFDDATLDDATLDDATLDEATLDEATLACVRRRCRRIGVVARGRVRGDPLRIDHAHARTALALCRRLDAAQLAAWLRDAARSPLGVPASEPGWVRLVDGVLAALALDALTAGAPLRRRRPATPSAGRGDELPSASLRSALTTTFAARGGHRPCGVWTPLGLRGPHATPWEHSTACALACVAGWSDGASDWGALRARTLAAMARRAPTSDDERLVAAGRLWLTRIDDPTAARVLQRSILLRDPLAAAVDRLAAELTSRPDPTHGRPHARHAVPTAIP